MTQITIRNEEGEYVTQVYCDFVPMVGHTVSLIGLKEVENGIFQVTAVDHCYMSMYGGRPNYFVEITVKRVVDKPPGNPPDYD